MRFEWDVWERFLGAVGGLLLAFTAAVFSTVTRQAGQVWATAILASLALLLAGIAGAISVPFLARRIALRRLRDAMDYEMTREGLVYLGIVLVIGIAALNTGNNLLFIVLSAMLAAILVSGVTSAWMLRGLTVNAAIPQHIFAGQRQQAQVWLRNLRSVAPAFSVSVVPPHSKTVRQLRWERRIFEVPRGAPVGKQWLRLPDIALRIHSETRSQEAIFTGREYFPFLAPGAAVARDVDLLFPRRGRYTQEDFGISTRFPFSFLTKTRRLVLPEAKAGNGSKHGRDKAAWEREVVVYPSVEPPDALLEVLPRITGEFESYVRGRGNDLYRIREYMPGDSARHVDWKATARTQSLKVREFTREDERKLRIVFDNPEAGQVSEEAYERGIAMAASLAWHFAGQRAELDFEAPEYTQEKSVYGFLRYLALVQRGEGVQPESPLLEKLAETGAYNVVVTARSQGSIPVALWGNSYFHFFSEMQ
ncbi:MAG: DUF58 domain-containing protein [Candidatus Korobacteraceae bacterium]